MYIIIIIVIIIVVVIEDTNIPLDYIALMVFIASFEIFALKRFYFNNNNNIMKIAIITSTIITTTRNWTRWLSNEYNHQFDHNIGIGNLQSV